MFVRVKQHLDLQQPGDAQVSRRWAVKMQQDPQELVLVEFEKFRTPQRWDIHFPMIYCITIIVITIITIITIIVIFIIIVITVIFMIMIIITIIITIKYYY